MIRAKQGERDFEDGYSVFFKEHGGDYMTEKIENMDRIYTVLTAMWLLGQIPSILITDGVVDGLE